VAEDKSAWAQKSGLCFQRPLVDKNLSLGFQVRAAGFLAAASKIVSSTLFGTCWNVSGSME
jgi:hypothetical protein